jgi:hypothetical protein
MTSAELTEIRARVNAATEGPWRACVCDSDSQFEVHSHEDAGDSLDIADCYSLMGPPDAVKEANTVFIANARTDVPRLLDEVGARAEDSANLTAIRDLLKAGGKYSGHRYGIPGDVQLLLGAEKEIADLKYDLNFVTGCLGGTDEALKLAEEERDDLQRAYDAAEDELDVALAELYDTRRALEEAQLDADQANFYLGEVEKENEHLRARPVRPLVMRPSGIPIVYRSGK